jgi:hypothetical protein
MIPSILLIAGIASRRVRLQRPCAQIGTSATPGRLRPDLALQTSDSNPATPLARSFSATPCAPVRARPPHLIA